MKLYVWSLFVVLQLFSLTSASFYDNPSLELPPEEGTPLEELKLKWGTDVSKLRRIRSCGS